MNDSNKSKTLRVEIWMNDNMEWSLEGDGSDAQYQQAGMKISTLFKDENDLKLVRDKSDVSPVSKDEALSVVKDTLSDENIMLCDGNFTRMMVFFYLNR